MRIAGVALDGLVTLLAIAGCLCLFGLTGLILGDVVGRGTIAELERDSLLRDVLG
jgi:hypothetical protein